MSGCADKKIGFFIVGTQKGGSTALHEKLARHPDLWCSRTKELHIFDNDSRDWTRPDFSDVAGYFEGASNDHLWGEATPAYMYWPHAIERLARYNPQAKLIISLRHPALRAFSHWRMETARGLEDLPFDQAVSDVGRARGAPFHRIYSYVERGFYARQITRILEVVPREQIMFCTVEHLFDDEQGLLNEIYDFLGVTKGVGLEGPKFVRPHKFSYGEIDASELRSNMVDLSQLYRDDILKTEQLTQLALAHWREDTYMEDYIFDQTSRHMQPAAAVFSSNKI